jgi:hypothetical protein
MILAITGQWVSEVTLVLCLFGAACIGLAVIAPERSERGVPGTAQQKATERNPAGEGTGRPEI